MLLHSLSPTNIKYDVIFIKSFSFYVSIWFQNQSIIVNYNKYNNFKTTVRFSIPPILCIALLRDNKFSFYVFHYRSFSYRTSSKKKNKSYKWEPRTYTTIFKVKSTFGKNFYNCWYKVFNNFEFINFILLMLLMYICNRFTTQMKKDENRYRYNNRMHERIFFRTILTSSLSIY